VSAFVICLIVVGAAIAVVRAADHEQPATVEPERDRDVVPRRPKHLAAGEIIDDDAETVETEPPIGRGAQTEALDVPLGRRVRSGALLALLLTGLGAAAAIGLGFLVIVLVTAVRTAIG
jgi:hypothetical protein